GYCSNGVVVSENARPRPAVGLAGKHGLLERSERPGLDDIGRKSATQADSSEHPELVGRREYDAGRGEDQEEAGIESPPADTVAQGADGDRHESRPGEDGGEQQANPPARPALRLQDRKSTRLNSSHASISYAVFCLKKK